MDCGFPESNQIASAMPPQIIDLNTNTRREGFTMRKSKVRFAIALLLPLAVGAVSALITWNNMELYQGMQKPPFSPPSVVFPIAWTILYLMMGAASYFASTTNKKDTAIFIANIWYLLQLLMNFFWSIIFFGLRMYLLAFVWLIFMYLAIIMCTLHYYRISKLAGWLMIPYNIWMAFAAYLNLGIIILN